MLHVVRFVVAVFFFKDVVCKQPYYLENSPQTVYTKNKHICMYPDIEAETVQLKSIKLKLYVLQSELFELSTMQGRRIYVSVPKDQQQKQPG